MLYAYNKLNSMAVSIRLKNISYGYFMTCRINHHPKPHESCVYLEGILCVWG